MKETKYFTKEHKEKKHNQFDYYVCQFTQIGFEKTYKYIC
jgi:hypothetical protein